MYKRHDFYNAVDQIRTRLGKNAICLQLPIGKEDEFKGIIDLFEMQAYIYNDEKCDDISVVDIPEEMKDEAELYHTAVSYTHLIDKAIIAEDTVIGDNVVIGVGSEVPNRMKPNIYSGGLATIGENSVIPSGVQIGKNTAVSGVTSIEDYDNGLLASGETLIKAGDRV